MQVSVTWLPSTATTLSCSIASRFSVALVLVLLAIATPAAAQDASPLDRLDTPAGEEDDDTIPVIQHAPPTPRAAPSPDEAPSDYRYAPPPRGYPPPARTPEIVAYEEKTEPRYGLVIGGSILLGLSYGIPLSIVAAADFPNHTDWLAVPVVGPWITMARMSYGSCRHANTIDNPCDDGLEKTGDVLGAVALGFTGVMQAAGLTMLVVGAAAQKTRVVPVYAVAPLVLDRGLGASVTGSF